jgi:diguanylate cyclase (GGDEF)-like protein/PAS domain S-box-containing protein
MFLIRWASRFLKQLGINYFSKVRTYAGYMNIERRDKLMASSVEQVSAKACALDTDALDGFNADDRRSSERRESLPARAFEPLNLEHMRRNWVPRSWPFLTLSMIVTIAVSITLSESLPGTRAGLLLIAGMAGAGCIGLIHRNFVSGASWFDRFGRVVAVVAPLLVYGLGITIWVESDGLQRGTAIALLLCIGGIASVYLRRQPGVLVAAQWSIWLGPVLYSPSLNELACFVAAAVLTILVAKEQLSEDQAEEESGLARERAQTRARDILADYEDTGQGWFWETDRRGLLSYVSGPVAEALGRDPKKIIGQPLVQLFDLEQCGNLGERTLMFHLSARSSFKELTLRAATDGEDRWWAVSGRPIYDIDDNFLGFRGSGTEVTERKRSEDEATRLANFDSLTGLANRLQISKSLEKILNNHAEADRSCAIFLLDLDRFKHVNDTMGHPAGDALLKQVAKRLQRTVGAEGEVGRLGGDEFKVIIRGKPDREQLADLAAKIIHSLSQPYGIEGQRVVIGASVGIAIAPEDGTKTNKLVRNADLALYAAKDGGRGRYHFFASDLHAEAEARAQMEEDLRDAIAKGELQLHYQPIVSTTEERITGFEALMRWKHPAKGWIPPERFIKIAEDTGLIVELGEWALHRACLDLANMPGRVRVAVNVSPLQFCNPKLPSIVADSIAKAKIFPDQLELEITESVFLSDDEGSDRMFKALKAIGVRFALDDFGTGYSSLGYLKTAPFDKIKIDQSFVRGATQAGSRNGAIIASITNLADALGMETTAEGVETLDELELVRMHGCSHVQGFIYERPLDAAEAAQRLSSGLSAVAQGPRAARSPRHTMLRRVVLEHGGNFYDGKIRNISDSGAMIEGLWDVPEGTIFKVWFSNDTVVACKTNWAQEDRLGVEFFEPLKRDSSGRLMVVQATPLPPVRHVKAA